MAPKLVLNMDKASLNSALEKVSNASFDEARLSGFIPDIDSQGQLYRVMKDGAKVVIVGISSREAGVELTNDMKMMGFGEVMVAKDDDQTSRFWLRKSLIGATQVKQFESQRR